MAVYSYYFSRVLQLLNLVLNLECVALLLQIHRILLKNNDYSKFILKLLKKNFFSSKLQAKGLVGKEHVLFVFYLLFFFPEVLKRALMFFLNLFTQGWYKTSQSMYKVALLSFFSEIMFCRIFVYLP